ncbi:L-type lectin-domain containing receptor kinase S.5 [Pyrus ussuriensis x Pyrus communis]|uniref:L-type lectin-domain containing receptor kinase S.5 n=1 Tax=Pyrus ussuriensis x Pyrus communis TaxID=2448454 RepID=A0A5N5HKU0_9ROSA|nr:L-type lectin-domain containing receptor kinase S.5 [Pyrus ussuriensis x Pyrus communis]
MAWHRPRFVLPRLGCLPKMRKLLEFNFLAAIDGAVKDEAAKIGAAEDKMSNKRTVECKMAAAPLPFAA